MTGEEPSNLIQTTEVHDAAHAAFLSMNESKDVAALLGMPQNTFNFVLYGMKGRSYAKFEIPKRFGGTRTIEAPVTALKPFKDVSPMY